MSKRIDMSVLPDGFLVELIYPKKECVGVVKKYVSETQRYIEGGWLMRPALNHLHFNDGSMTLPLGLVCKFKTTTGITFIEPIFTSEFCLYSEIRDREVIIAVKILGVTPEYGAQLGMEIIELEGMTEYKP